MKISYLLFHFTSLIKIKIATVYTNLSEIQNYRYDSIYHSFAYLLYQSIYFHDILLFQ